MKMKLYRQPSLWSGLLLAFLGGTAPAGQLPGIASESEIQEVRQAFVQWSDCLKQGKSECVLSWMWNSADLQVITGSAEIIRGWQGFSKKLEQMPAQPDLEYKVESATPLGADTVTILYSVMPAGEKNLLKKLLGSMLWVKKQEGWRCTQVHLVQRLDGKPPFPGTPSLEDLSLPPPPTLPNRSSARALTIRKSESSKSLKQRNSPNLEDPAVAPSTTLPERII